MVETNTFYNCECVYFDTGYILCKICETWTQSTTTVQPNFVGKRWSRKTNELNRKFKNSFC